MTFSIYRNTRAWFYPLIILALPIFIGAVQANVEEGSPAITDTVVVDETATDSETCNYPLTGVSIDMDTDIVFLPTQQDTQKQALALESDDAQNGPEFNDGRIRMVAHITSLTEVADLPTRFCLVVGNVCESLLVWDSQLQGYSPVFTVEQIVDNGPTSVYLDMLIPPDLIEEIRPMVANPVEFKIRGSVVCPISDVGRTASAVGLELATVPVVDVPSTRSARLKLTTDNGISISQAFEKSFSASEVSVSFGVEGRLNAKSEKAEEIGGKGKKTLTLSATAHFNTTIFLEEFSLFEAVLASAKESGKKFKTSVTLSAFGINFYDQVLSKSHVRDGRESRSADDEGKFSLELAMSWTKEKGVTSRFMLGPVPLKVTVGAKGEVGINGNITPNIGASKMIFNVSDMGPFVDIGAYATAAADAFFAEAGVRANLSLLEEQFVLNSNIMLDNGFSATGNLSNILTGPEGSIELYAEWTEPKFCSTPVCVWKICETIYYPCGVHDKDNSKTLANWTSGLREKRTLASWNESSPDAN
jgi:hypothetical protein